MKKVFLMAVAAVAMLASCSNDETTGKAVKGNAIQFDGFVNKSVKGVDDDITNDNLNNFQVWGLMSKGGPTGNPFDGTTVTKKGSDWTYTTPVYWENGYNYSFVAIAPAGFGTFNAPSTVGEWGSIDFENGEGTTDLIYDIDDTYATSPVSTEGVCPVVNLTFNHLLSRVMFEFKNAMDDNSTINVTGVTITNANTKATATLGATATWALADDNAPAALNFGDVLLDAEATDYAPGAAKATDHKYMIPATSADQKYVVTFVVTRHHSGVTDQYNHEVEIPAVTMEQGKSYKFTAELNAQNITGGDPDDPDNPQLCPIKFTATVSDWGGFNETELVLPSASSQEP